MFTRDQINEIKKKLIMLGTKDTQFPDAHKLNGEEIIAIVQDGENKKIPLSSIINDDFINVSKDTTEILTLSTAVSKIDTNNRKLGQVITFKDSANSWAIRQFTGSSLDNWNDISLWKSISGIDELKSQVETNAEDISVLSDEIERHDTSILNLNTDVSKLKDKDIETSSSLSELNTKVDTLKSQADTNTSNISSLNTEVSAIQSKVDENTTSISQINTELDNKNDEIAQINNTLAEHTESINAKITTDRIEDGAVISEKIATSVFDSTLSVSGKIAPADIVGEKIDALKSEIDNIIGNYKENYSTNYFNSIIDDDGYCVSDYIPCPNGKVTIVYSDAVALGGKYICFVDDSNNLVSRQNQNVARAVSITPPEGATKFRFTFIKGFAAYAAYNGTHIYDAIGMSEKLDEKISVIADMAKNNTLAIEQLETRTEELSKTEVEILGNYIINKSLDNNNSAVVADGYCVSDYIPCPDGTFQVYYSDAVALGTKYLCFVDDNETLISATKLTSVGGMSITPPEGATKFRFTFVKGFAAYAAYKGIRIYESKDMDDILVERFKDSENDIQDLDERINSNQDNIANLKSPYRLDYPYRWPYIKEIYISPDCSLGWSTYYLRTIWSNNNGKYRIVLSSDLNNTQTLIVEFRDKPANAPINVKDSGIYVCIDWDSAPVNVSFSYEIIKEIALDARQNPLSFAEYIRNNSYLGSKDEQIVTLISDDLSNERTAARLADICDGIGIKCTFALIPNYDENGLNPSISESKKSLCYDFIQRGHSIAMHPNHVLFYGANGTQQGTPEECEKCLAQTRMMFKREGILDGDNFLVWPGSSGARSGADDLHPMAERQVKLAVHSGYWNQTFLNNRENFNRYMVRRLPVLAGDNTVEEFKILVDEFVASGKGWLVLMTHDHWLLEDNESKTQSYQNYFSEITEILQYILDKGIPFKTLTDAYNNKVTEEYLPALSLMKK